MGLSRTRRRCEPTLLAGLTALVYAVLSLRRYAHFEVSSWDMAIFEQALAGYARWSAPIADVKGPGFHILGDHFSPIYAVLAPAYRWWPGPHVLLLAQVLLIAVSVYVITGLAVRHLPRWAGVAVGAAYAVSFGVQSAVKADFHEVAFAAPLLACAGAAWVERRPGAVVGWSVPLLLVKEDLGITVALVGVLLWWSGERRRGVVLVGAGVVTTVLVLAVVLPAFNDSGHYAYTGTFGGQDGLWRTLVASLDVKARTLLLTFGITGLAALFSPWVLLSVPTLAWRFAGDVEHYWGTDWHYSLVLMPIVFCAAIDAVVRHERARLLLPAGALVTIYSLIGSGVLELADPDLYRDTPRAEASRGALEALPDGAIVETDIALLSHAVADHQVYWTGTIGEVTPDYVLFDTAVGIGSPDDPMAWAVRTHGGAWTEVYREHGIVLLHRDR